MYWNQIDSAQADATRCQEAVQAARANRAARENSPGKVLGEVGLVLAGALSVALAVQLACNLFGIG